MVLRLFLPSCAIIYFAKIEMRSALVALGISGRYYFVRLMNGGRCKHLRLAPGLANPIQVRISELDYYGTKHG